jgi:hypothetical protein
MWVGGLKFAPSPQGKGFSKHSRNYLRSTKCLGTKPELYFEAGTPTPHSNEVISKRIDLLYKNAYSWAKFTKLFK